MSVRVTYDVTYRKTENIEADSLCDLGHAKKRLRNQAVQDGATYFKFVDWEVVKDQD